MDSSQLSQPAKNRLEYKKHLRGKASSPALFLFNHTGFLERLLLPLSETILYPLIGETGIYDGFNAEGEASPRSTFCARRDSSSTAHHIIQTSTRCEAHASALS